MCRTARTQSGGCFSEVHNSNDKSVARHGCMELLQDEWVQFKIFIGIIRTFVLIFIYKRNCSGESRNHIDLWYMLDAINYSKHNYDVMSEWKSQSARQCVEIFQNVPTCYQCQDFYEAN